MNATRSFIGLMLVLVAFAFLGLGSNWFSSSALEYIDILSFVIVLFGCWQLFGGLLE